MSILRWIHRRVPNLVPIGPAVWQLSQTLICDPITPPPPNASWGIEGRIVLSLCPFPDESADVYQIWCRSIQPFESFPKLLNLWSPNPPPPSNASCGSEGRIVFSLCPFPDESADVNQSWCHRSSRLTASQDFWMFDPLKPPSAPCVSKGILFGVYPFPDESAHVCQIWCQSVQPFDSFNILLNLWPPKTLKMPPGILRGELYLAYAHSQTNLQTCTKFGANRSSCLTASLDFWICDPLKPLGILRGELYLAYVHSQTNPKDLYQIWYQSVQPFDRFPKHVNLWSPKTPRNAPGVLRGG